LLYFRGERESLFLFNARVSFLLILPFQCARSSNCVSSAREFQCGTSVSIHSRASIETSPSIQMHARRSERHSTIHTSRRQCLLAMLDETFVHAPLANAAFCAQRAEARGRALQSKVTDRARPPTLVPGGVANATPRPAPGRHHWYSKVTVGGPLATARANTTSHPVRESPFQLTCTGCVTVLCAL
jgi:hypothetical protein